MTRVVFGLIALVPALASGAAPAARVDFRESIRTIFEKRCIGCHGSAQQMAGVRLDDRVKALAGGYSGPVILPGNSAGSLLIRMVTTGRDGKVMPPAGARLTEAEVAILRRWIDEGAKWPEDASAAAQHSRSSHWAFQPVRRPEPPAVRNANWISNSIDAFVLARLEQEGLAPSPEAGKRALFRRLSLDLVGLPPTPSEIARFLADAEPAAYERLVDRLLASPHFGEKWARHWLDLARYADSDGYDQDAVRPNAWRYRDWVIEALNQNMPFDRFTREQIAGDLLPNPTLEQLAATGFHRNTLTPREGGTDIERRRDEQVMDRANTVGTVWLGLTVECARCHDHKYDPISQKDYYQLFAFFNSAEEVDLDAPIPGEVGPYLQRLPEYEKKLRELMRRYRVTELQPRWEAEVRAAAAHPEARLEWTQVLEYLAVYFDHGREILMIPPAQRTPKQAHGMMRVFLKYPGPMALEPELKDVKFGQGFKELEDLDRAYPGLGDLNIIREMRDPPKTYIHLRGDFRSPGIEVQPDVPAVLPPLAAGVKRDRLALANWLVSPENPLTARVAVNRLWQELFGKGLVATSEDFGTRGEPPTHPKLLDWLAAEFVASGWDVKHMIKLIAMSATYRQSSQVRQDLETRDPANRLLARQSRMRLPAELIRDATLSVSGLLNPAVGGKSIRPPLPAGTLEVAYRARWDESQGPERYRRGLYILFQRSIPYPQLMNFDAPNSLLTCSRRERSTTPLQALNLLNDPVFFEAAQAFAFRLLREQPGDPDQRIRYAYELALGRLPEADELATVKNYYLARRQREPSGNDTAAWVGVSSILLNMDEFLTRE